MKKLSLALMVAVLPTLAIAAGQSGPESKKLAKPTTLRPTKSTPCAEYGPGFVQIEGTTTCIKVGGGVTFESRGRR